MNKSDIICNFQITNIGRVDELKANLYEMEHIKSGAKLLWIDRKDENKTFCIGFKTLPEDSTGVFHILEHSVLNGSDKYPAKEPFVELLKSSLNTFLNAMTFPDKTIYPISSRNDKDYLNLVNVYMDAVLHPLIYKRPEIFMQEGWHYELLSRDEEPSYKGVVFNEMKGALSSPNDAMQGEMSKLLFPDNCYGFISGGDPDHIPELTYEQFINSHKKYYHPSNSYIILDGSVDLKATLTLLDSEFLSKYDRQIANFDIPMQSPVPYREVEKPYEIAPNDSTNEKTIVSSGYVIGSYEDKETLYAMNILCDVLAGSINAPLKNALLSAGLGQDVDLSVNDGIQQPYVALSIWNTDKEKLGKIKETVHSTLSELVKNGLDREQLVASFNSMEFAMRSRESGRMPLGLMFSINTLESWIYGGDPAQNLSYDKTFANLREKLSTRYFEDLIDKYLLNNPHCGLLCMVPSNTLGQEKYEKELAKLKAAKESWSEGKINELIKVNESLIKWQQTPDTQEGLDSIPVLKLSDIKPEPEDLPLFSDREEDLSVIVHNMDTDGIQHISLYFSASDLKLEDLPYASLLTALLGRLGTSKHSPLELQTMLKSNIGRVNIVPEVYSKSGTPDTCQVFLTADLSLLTAKEADGLKLVRELLTETDFNNPSMIKNMLQQMEMQCQQGYIGSGHSCAAARVRAYNTASGVAGEYLGGYEYYSWIKEMNKNIDANMDSIIGKLKSLAERMFTRDRITLSVSGEKADSELLGMANSLPYCKVKAADEAHYKPLGIRQEGIIIPAAVSFAVKGSNIYLHNASYNGSCNVLSKLLSMDYLWNAIRVQGGAYGAGFNSARNGNVFFYSYRDPNAVRSLDSYDKAADFVKSYCKDGNGLEKLIIGSISDSEPLSGPKGNMKMADSNYFCGVTFEDRCSARKEMLSTTKEDLLKLCDTLKAVCDDNAICVIGGKDKLDACGEKLSSILSI
jgi:Zn-dependent M16 (insulinase) family peptidase